MTCSLVIAALRAFCCFGVEEFGEGLKGCGWAGLERIGWWCLSAIVCSAEGLTSWLGGLCRAQWPVVLHAIIDSASQLFLG